MVKPFDFGILYCAPPVFVFAPPPIVLSAPASAILFRVSPSFLATFCFTSFPEGSTPTFWSCLMTTSLVYCSLSFFSILNFALDEPYLGSIVSILALVSAMMMFAVPSGPISPSFFFYVCFFKSLTEKTGGCFSFINISSFLMAGGSLAGCFGCGFAFGLTSAGTAYFGFGGGRLAEPNAAFGPVSFFLVPVNAGVGSNFLLSGGGRVFGGAGYSSGTVLYAGFDVCGLGLLVARC